MASSYEELLLQFCNNHTNKEMGGGINDQYTLEDYNKFREKIDHLPNSKISDKKLIIEDEISNAKILHDEIIAMYNSFQNFSKPNRNQEFIENKFPKGYQIDDINKLELKNLDQSAAQFKDLFQRFFKRPLNKGELVSIFGSITNYPLILPISFGLMSIDGLWNLFNEIYFPKTGNQISITKKEFFLKFLSALAVNSHLIKTDKIDTKNFDNIKTNFEYNEFNCDLWYKPIPANKNDYDSYGLFYEKPVSSGGVSSNIRHVYLKYSNELLKKNINMNTMVQYLLNPSTHASKTNIVLSLDSKTTFKEKILKDFNPQKFKESIKNYFQNPRRQTTTLINETHGKTDYIDIKLETDLFLNIRALLHLSNIYTTYVRLFKHFFDNIIECYKIYSNAFIITNNMNKTDIGHLKNRIDILIKIITKIPEKFSGILVNYQSNNDSTKRFLGFTETTYEYFLSYDVSNNNDFMRILMIFFKLNKLQVGGIPYRLDAKDTSKLSKDIIIVFTYFLKYRIISISNYIKLLDNIKHQANQKIDINKYHEVKDLVERKIADLKNMLNLVGTDDNNIFENCKITLSFSTFFFDKLRIQTIKDFKYEENSQYSKNNSEISKKIGELKEYLNQYIIQLRKELNDKRYTIFHEFLYGILSKYIYYAEIYSKIKNEIIDPNLKKLLNLKNNKLNEYFENISKRYVDILTKNNSIVSKRRLLIGTEYKTISDNAKSLIQKTINPEIYTSSYWSEYEKKFMDNSNNKKLFVIAVEPWINVIEKIAKVNVFLIDLFQTLKSDSNPIVKNKIKTIDELGTKIGSEERKRNAFPIKVEVKNSVTKIAYSNKNNIIHLNPFARAVRDLGGWFKRKMSKDIEGPIKKAIFGKFFSAEGLHQPGFIPILPGKRFAKKSGIYRKKFTNPKTGKEEFFGYSNTEILQLLISDQLSHINSEDKIKFSLLMGYNNHQLNGIIQTYENFLANQPTNKQRSFFNDIQKYNKYKYDPSEKKNDWQIYVIKKEDYSSSNKMREWANRLLNSKPLVFPLKYVKKPDMIPISDFSKIQVPFSKYFIKRWYTHKNIIIRTKDITDYLFQIYDLIHKIQTEKNKNNKFSGKIFYSTEEFFNYNIKRHSNNINIQPYDVKATRTPNTTSLGIEENQIYSNFDNFVGIPELRKVPNMFNPTRLRAESEFMNKTKINKLRPINISNSLGFKDTIKTNLESILNMHNISLNRNINVVDEKGETNILKFTDDLTIDYLGRIEIINYERKNNIFYANINLPSQNRIIIYIKTDAIVFHKQEYNYIIKMILNYDKSSLNYYLDSDYKNIDFKRIFGYTLSFTPRIIYGFLFYENNVTQNDFKLEILDDSNNSILNIKFNNVNGSDSITYDEFENINNFYWLQSKGIAIISIPKLEVYKKSGSTYSKLTFNSNKFEWKNISQLKSNSDFVDLLKAQSISIKSERQLLMKAINKFEQKIKITKNSSKNYIIKLKNGDKYTIDVENLILYFNSSKPIQFNLVNSELCAIIQKQDLINAEIKFCVTENDIYITHSFDVTNNPSMNFNGELKLYFQKDSSNDIILDYDYYKDTNIQKFMTSNQIMRLIFGLFQDGKSSSLTYNNNFFEIYYGIEESTQYNAVFFRALNKDRQPMPELNFTIADKSKELYLDNFYLNGDDQFIEFISKKSGGKMYLYTNSSTEIDIYGNKKFFIILSISENKIYIIFEKKINSNYVICHIYNKNGYGLHDEITDAGKIDELRQVVNLPP